MSKFTIGQILGCLLLIVISASTTLAKPIIINASEAARPGDVISIQGSQFGAAPQVWFEYVTAQTSTVSPAQQIPIVNSQATGYVAATIPANQPVGLYVVWVSDGAALSDPIFINRARGIQCEYPTLSGGYAFRIFGRNLMLAGATPTVTFVNASTGARTAAAVTVSGSNAFVLKVTSPPSIASNARYTLELNNGYGGSYGDADAEETVVGRTGGPDPFALGVPWAPDLNASATNVYNVRTDTRLSLHAQGNGRANDRDAIQAAIDTATAAGGGTVYLPSGTYCLDYTPRMGVNCYTADKLLLLKTGVVLRGDGMDGNGQWRTVLKWGFTTGLTVSVRPPLGYGIVFDMGTSRSGITGLCCQNLNGSVVSGSVAVYRPLLPQSRLFLTNAEFDIGSGSGLTLSGADTLLLSNTITVQDGYEHVWDLSDASHYWVRGNSVVYSVNRLFASQCNHLIFENNHITRDGDNFPPISVTNKGTGGLSSEQSSQVVILNNTFDATGAALPSYNDGETILSEWAAPNRDVGTVSGASSTSLQDTGKRWTYGYGGQGYVVAIVRGTGLGQVRTVIGSTANTLTIDHPWDVVPTAGSHYTLVQPSAQEWLVKDNVLQNVPQGILIYEGGNDCAIVGNSLINGGQIYLRADQRLTDAPSRFQICWNMRVEDNTVTDADGLHLGAIEACEDREDPYSLWGTGLLGEEIRRNQVTAYAPTSVQRWEGFGNFVQWAHSELYPANDTDIGILGSVFQDNVTNNAFSAFYTGTGASATTFWNAARTGPGQMMYDNLILGASLPSSNTIIGASPAGLQAAAGTGAASLNWQPVSGGNGYQIYRASSSSGPWTLPVANVATPTYLDSGLSGGSQYYYLVKAIYSGASQSQSLPSAIVTLRAHLAIPTGLTAAPGTGQAHLSWQAVAGANTYNVYRSSVSGGPYTLTGAGVTTPSFVDTGVPNGQQEFYVVAAVDTYEVTSYSAEVSATPQSAPEAPAGLSGVPGNTQVALSWHSAKGATAYSVYRSVTSGNGYVRIASLTSLSYLDTNVVNGKTYYYVVRGDNQGVEGPTSAELAVAPVAPPVSPTTLSVKPGDGVLTLSWVAAPGATSYKVYRGTAHGGPYSNIGSVQSSPYDDRSVTKGTTYYYIVTGFNAGGEGQHSTEVSGMAPTAPARPTALSAKLSGTSVTLTWSAAPGATGYNIYQSRTQGGPYTQTGPTVTSTNCTLTGLRDGPYYYVVTAVNIGGETGYSPEASVVLAPLAPSNLVVHGGTGSVTLLWTATQYTSLYHVYRATGSGGPFGSPLASVNTIDGVTTPIYVDNHMTRGTTYYYVVRAVGATGLESASSGQVSAHL